MMTTFFSALAIIGYVYLGYPLFLWLGAFGRKRSFARDVVVDRCVTRSRDRTGQLPSLSILVAAHNEEAAISGKIANLLAIDYPSTSFEILVGDDGSSDRTRAIIRSFAVRGVRLIASAVQQGKSAMQNRLVAASSGDVLVFTDADCVIAANALRSLVQHLADPRVGLVTARPRFVNDGEAGIVANESLYLRYETWLRAQESSRGVLAMASGSLFALRRSLWQPLEASVGDDFALPLQVMHARMRNVLDTRVIATTWLSQDCPLAMLRMKTRVISKDLRALLLNRPLLNPLRHGTTALALCSHKLLRWLVPYFLVILAVSNLCLLARRPFRDAAMLQLSFYAAALFGLALHGRRRPLVLTLPMSFCLVNLAALGGTLHCCFGGTFGRWEPDRGARPGTAITAMPASPQPQDSQ